MNFEEFRLILNKKNSLVLNDDFALEECWNQEIEMLSKNEEDTIRFINECLADEYVDLKEVIDDVILKTNSRKILEAFKKLKDKYPKEYNDYRIGFVISICEDYLE